MPRLMALAGPYRPAGMQGQKSEDSELSSSSSTTASSLMVMIVVCPCSLLRLPSKVGRCEPLGCCDGSGSCRTMHPRQNRKSSSSQSVSLETSLEGVCCESRARRGPTRARRSTRAGGDAEGGRRAAQSVVEGEEGCSWTMLHRRVP